MSSTRTEKNCSKPQITKSNKSDKASGKPCIDFQPGDRWQIKEDSDEEECNSNRRRRSSRKRKGTPQSSDSEIKIITVNGESTKTESDQDEHSDCVELKNGPVSKKIKASTDQNSKNSDVNDSTKNGDSEVISNCDSSKESEKTTKSDASECESEKLSAPILEDERTNTSNKEIEINEDASSSKEDISAEKSMPELSCNQEVKSNPDVDEVSEVDKEGKVVTGSGDEDEVSEIDKDGKVVTVSGDEEEDSDGDVQIIDNVQDTKKINAIAEEKLFQEPLKKDDDKEELLRSPGFPYYNALNKDVDFSPGRYKPVKFPHMGTLFLEDNEVIIESPSLLVPLLIKETDKFPRHTDKDANGEIKPGLKPKSLIGINFFQSTVGQFMINLGTSRVMEWYHKDMKRSKMRKLRKSGGGDEELEEQIKWHDRKLKATKDSNVAFNFRLRKCDYCEFKTESRLVLEGHFLTPHLTARREFRCNFCGYICRDPKDISFHYEAIHSKRVVSEDQLMMHECLFCSFHSQLKSKVNAHMNRCRKNFLPSQNQGPLDFEFPGVTTKPVTMEDVVAHRKMLMGTSKFNNTSEAINALARKKLATALGVADVLPDSPTLIKHLIGQHSKQQAAGLHLPPGIVLTRPRVRGPLPIRPPPAALQPRMPGVRPVVARGAPFPNNLTTAATQLASSGISITPIGKDAAVRMAVASGKNLTLTPISSTGNQIVSQKPGPPQPVALFTNVAGNERPGLVNPSTRMPSNVNNRLGRVMPPYQRLNTPPSQVVKNSSGNTFVLCEICDSYIKDLEDLRSHMNWVHKVKIHPKMLVSRPPLNCQKCQWRFFTDQGLERHLLGAHGLVTTNMQEMANKNQDGGRCIICGAVFTYKLVSHMTQVHKVTLKPAHLSYKCTVCTATFTLYRLFESHVYNVHSATAKRSADDSPSSEPPPAKKAAIEEKKDNIKKVDTPVVKSQDQSGTVKCHYCKDTTGDIQNHLIEKHIIDCSVKLCRIEKCEKCLSSSGEMLVMHLSDFENESGSEGGVSDDESDASESSAN